MAGGREGPEVRPGPGGPRRSRGGRCEPTAPGAGARGDGSLRPDSRSRGPGFPPPPAEARGVKTEELPPWGVRQSPAASLRITPWLSIVSFPIVMRERRSRLKRILEEDAAPGHAPLSPRAGSVFHGHLPGTGLWGGAPRGGGTRLGSRPRTTPPKPVPRGVSKPDPFVSCVSHSRRVWSPEALGESAVYFMEPPSGKPPYLLLDHDFDESDWGGRRDRSHVGVAPRAVAMFAPPRDLPGRGELSSPHRRGSDMSAMFPTRVFGTRCYTAPAGSPESTRIALNLHAHRPGSPHSPHPPPQPPPSCSLLLCV